MLEILHPEKIYTAVDYNEEIISVVKSIKYLKNIEYLQVDALNEREGVPKANLTMCVNFEYHFDDQQLSDIFEMIYKNESDLLIITHTIATPLRYLKSMTKHRNVKEGKLRYHGYERSEKLLKKIAKNAGLHFHLKYMSNQYNALLFKRK